VWLFDWLSLLDASVLFSLVQHATTVAAAWRLRSLVPTDGRFVTPGGALVPVIALASIVLLCAVAFGASGKADAVDVGHFVALAIVLGAGALVAALSRRARREVL
jgi:hypothetical protein